MWHVLNGLTYKKKNDGGEGSHYKTNAGLQLADATKWYNNVDIAASRFVSEAALEKAVEALKVCKRIPSTSYDVSTFIDIRVAELYRDVLSMKLYDQSELVCYTYQR